MANEIKDLILPAQGYLNWDDDENYLPKGDTRYKMDVEIKKGNKLVITNKRGTEQITNSSLPAGTNTIIGWGEWVEQNALIFMVHNSNNNHCIQKLDLEEKSFSFIREGTSQLNFDTSYPIYDVKVIGSGDNAELVWTDNNTGIGKMKLDIGAATTIDESQIRLAKAQPLFKIQTALDSNTTLKSNNIWGHQYQFCCRFVYDTGEKSAWDGFSDVVFNFRNEFSGVGFSANSSLNNEIDLSWSETDIPNAVSYIELSVRKTDKDSGVWENWVLYDTIAYTSGVNSYTFRNDKVTQTIDQNEFTVPYYDIPLKAGSLEIISGNRVILGQPTKGYDNVDLNVTLSHVYKDETTASIFPSGLDTDTISDASNANTNISGSANEQFHAVIISDGTTTEYYYLSSDLNYATEGDIVDFFVAKINADSAYTITASKSVNDLNIANSNGTNIYVSYYALAMEEVFKTLKSGSLKYFGLLYLDSIGRSARVYVSDDTKIYIPFHTERDFGWTSDTIDYNLDTHFSNRVKYEISHLPPSWATHWAWVYGGMNIQNYFNVTIDTSNDITVSDSNIAIDLPQATSRYNDVYNLNNFDVEKGDRVRIVWIGSMFDHKYYREYVDFDVLKVDATNKVYIKNWDNLEISSLLENEYVTLEFYRVKKDFAQENLYYNVVGDVNTIVNGYHLASIDSGYGVTAQTQTAVLPAVGVIRFGDSYLGKVNEFLFDYGDYKMAKLNILESESSSYQYGSKQLSLGRLDYVDKNAKEQTYEAMVWGGKKSEGELNFNELNKFTDTNIQYLDSKHGEIVKLIESGYTLNSFQKNKVTTFYVDREVVTLADGTEQLYTTNTVLSKPYPLDEDIGSTLPRAFIKDGKDIIFMDLHKRKVFKKAVNGLFPISDLKMSRWFQETIDNGMGDPGYTFDKNDFVAGYDPYNEKYMFTFNFDGAYAKTIAFDKMVNRWCDFYSFTPSFYAFLDGYKLLAVVGDDTYQHDSESANRCLFYGSQGSSEVWVYSNEYPEQIKRYNAIELNSNEIWSLNDDQSILVYGDMRDFQNPETFITQNANQYSSIPDNNWVQRTGVFTSNFMRDAGSSNDVIDLLNGDPLKGKYIVMKFKNSSTYEAILRSVGVHGKPVR